MSKMSGMSGRWAVRWSLLAWTIAVVAALSLSGCGGGVAYVPRPLTNVISLEVTDTYTVWQMAGGAVSRMDITNNIADSRMVVSVDEYQTVAIPTGGQAFVYVRFVGRSSANISVVVRVHSASGKYVGADARNMGVSVYPRSDSWMVSSVQPARPGQSISY